MRTTLVLVSTLGSFANVFLLSTVDELGKSHGKTGRVESNAALGDDILFLHGSGWKKERILPYYYILRKCKFHTHLHERELPSHLYTSHISCRASRPWNVRREDVIRMEDARTSPTTMGPVADRRSVAIGQSGT
ncbi:hypothetical protein F5Y13DRAFT_153746 [Hypoxylon sp. FL1857]|nr:hypothetical protein F5Y13DRAFT_153746 [Hypoxylon sp. FL1857]